MKRAIILTVIFSMLLSLGVISASAIAMDNTVKKENPDMELMWVNTNRIDLGISYSGTTASCAGFIEGKSFVVNITATFTLRRVNSDGTTTTVATWYETSNGSLLGFSASYSPVSKGQTYTLSVSATLITSSGGRETVSDSITRTY